MSVLCHIAFFVGRRDEVPNRELARDLALAEDRAGIREIADNLRNENSSIQSDCLKVLYEIGYLVPELVAEYVDEFLQLLESHNNRMVWGGMIALSTIAGLKADDIFPHCDDILRAMDRGSVITRDAGVSALALVASRRTDYNRAVFPHLLGYLATCRPGDVPRYADKVAVAVGEDNKAEFVALLADRLPAPTRSQAARVRRVIRQLEKR